MAAKTAFLSSILTAATTQAVSAHQSLSPHVHPSGGAFYISWLEMGAGLTAIGLAATYYRFRQTKMKVRAKEEKARRK